MQREQVYQYQTNVIHNNNCIVQLILTEVQTILTGSYKNIFDITYYIPNNNRYTHLVKSYSVKSIFNRLLKSLQIVIGSNNTVKITVIIGIVIFKLKTKIKHFVQFKSTVYCHQCRIRYSKNATFKLKIKIFSYD